MPAVDFVAAQERLAARRRVRELAHQTHLSKRSARLSESRISAGLQSPFLRNVALAGQSTWNLISGREGTSPAFRVGQVDAELLDEEALDLLKGQFSEGLKYFGSNLAVSYSAEIQLLLRAILFKLSVWDHNASYGASLQGLRYADSSRKASLTIDGIVVPDSSLPIPSNRQKSLYGLITVFGKYGWTKWNDYLAGQEASFQNPDPVVKQLSKLSTLFDTTHTLLAVPSFACFLLDGRYRTLVDRMLGMRLVPASSSISRDVSFEYLNRQLVWHAFTEFLLFLLPLVGVSRWRKIARKGWKWMAVLFTSFRSLFPGSLTGTTTESEDENSRGEYCNLPKRTCGICYADQTLGAAVTDGGTSTTDLAGAGVIGSALTDITNPYEANPCGCVYCFSCLAQRIESEEGEGWSCLRCGETVLSCRPWSGDVIDVADIPTSKKDVIPSTPERRLSTASTIPYSPSAVDHQSPRQMIDSPLRRKSVGFARSVPLGLNYGLLDRDAASNERSFHPHEDDSDYDLGRISGDDLRDSRLQPTSEVGTEHRGVEAVPGGSRVSTSSFSSLPAMDQMDSSAEWAKSIGEDGPNGE